MPTKIATDVSILNDDKWDGTRKYAYELLNVLSQDSDYSLYFFSNAHITNSKLSKLVKSENVELIEAESSSFLWTNFSLPKLVNKVEPDIYWSVHHTSPIFLLDNNIKKITTIYDLAHYYDDKFLFQKSSLWKILSKWSAKSSDIVLTISKFTASEIEKFYKIPGDKIEMIYPSFYFSNANLGTPEDQNKKLDNLNLKSGKYILFIGTLQPRKNVINMVKAFNLLKEQDQYTDYKFALVGKEGWEAGSILEEINNSPYNKDIVRPGYLDDETASIVFSNAKVFLFATKYEGFGIPIVEAQSLNVPVVTSTVSSMPEVAGDAAILVDPEKPDEISNAISNILSDETSSAELIAKGQENIKRFTIEKSVTKLKSVFQKVVK